VLNEAGTYQFSVQVKNSFGSYSHIVKSGSTEIYGKTLPPEDVTGFDFYIDDRGVNLEWNPVSDLDLKEYEIQFNNVWGSWITRKTKANTLSIGFLPVMTTTFKIRAIDTSLNHSENETVIQVPIARPEPVELNSQQLNGQVILSWAIPESSFKLTHYKVFRNNELLKVEPSNYSVIQEINSGTFEYKVVPVDQAGNEGLASAAIVQVDNPPDFVSTGVKTDNFENGTFDNIYTTKANKLVPCFDSTQTIRQHFQSNNANTFRDLMNQGFESLIEPMTTTTNYETVFDLGVQLKQSRITLSIQKTIVNEDVETIPEIQVSDDNTNWITFSNTYQCTALNFRYVKIKLNFQSPSGKGHVYLESVSINVDARLITESGKVTANVWPQTIYFKNNFVDVDSITVSVQSDGTKKFDTYYEFDFSKTPSGPSFMIHLYQYNETSKLYELVTTEETVSYIARGY
jgi:hypothetical protein